MISTSACSRRTIVLRPTTPHLVWSATTTRRRAASIRARSVSASSRFGVVNPDRGVHAVDAHEDQVQVDVCERRHGERPDQRVRRGAHAAGEDDRLVRPTVLVEDVGDRRTELVTTVSPGTSTRPLGEGEGSRAGRDARSPFRARRACGGGIGDGRLLALLERGLDGEAGLEDGRCRRSPSRRRGPSPAGRVRAGAPGRDGWSCRRRRASRTRSATRTPPSSRTRSRIRPAAAGPASDRASPPVIVRPPACPLERTSPRSSSLPDGRPPAVNPADVKSTYSTESQKCVVNPLTRPALA